MAVNGNFNFGDFIFQDGSVNIVVIKVNLLRSGRQDGY